MKNEKKIGNLYCNVVMRVKLSLWSAFKLRIAGMKNVVDSINSNTSVEVNVNYDSKEKKK